VYSITSHVFGGHQIDSAAFEQALSLNPKLEQARHFLAQASEKIRQK
jgi:hypothetical protein